LTREILHLGAQALSILKESAMFTIQVLQLVDFGPGDAAADEGSLHKIGFATQLNEVNHGSSLTRALPELWRNRLVS
jgi:hypothetical protein